MPPAAAANRTAWQEDVQRDAVPPGATVTVTNVNDARTGSLRAAISRVNARHAAHAIISFSVNGTITLASDLPVLRVPVTIDGASAPEYAGRQ
jgi:hypothetical protein